MKEYDAKVRLNEEDGGKTGELDIMSKPPFDKGYFKGVTYGIEFKDPVFEAERSVGWIPCSERMPEEGGDYLVSGRWLDSKEPDVLIRAYYKDVGFSCKEVFETTAWMELPKPYEMGE